MITQSEYSSFQVAYDHFNRELFAEQALPQLLVTLQRQANTLGYLAPQHFVRRGNPSSPDFIHELALNPDGFVGRTDKEILSTLVHEMVHAWQVTYGKAGRRGYHNREWAEKMKVVGLTPISARGDDKQVGDSMTHIIAEGGRFEVACQQLLDTGFRLEWQSRVAVVPATPRKRKTPTTPAANDNTGSVGGENNVDDYFPTLSGGGNAGFDEDEDEIEADEIVDEEDLDEDRALGGPRPMMVVNFLRPQKNDRVKFTCPTCKLNAWAKPTASLLCGVCWDNGQGSIVVLTVNNGSSDGSED